MDTQRKVTVLIGSLRKNSVSSRLANALRDMAPPSLALETHGIGDLQFYNSDLEEQAPAAWKKFRERILSTDALLFITPEYNRSVPAVLKNAIDVASRPYGKNVWGGKPAAVVTFSPGPLGGFGANHHLRQMLVAINVAAMPAPEIYLSNANAFLGENGIITNADTKLFLQGVMKSFAAWIERNCLK